VIARSSTALVAAGLLALAGCAKGPIRGQLALPDQKPQAASLNYASSLFGKTGKLSTTLPTGESFTGPYMLDPAAPDKTISSTLAGNRGNSLVCRLTLTEPGVGPDGGGTVRCDLSTGGVFDARF
jgi:hypothetical protein